MAEPAHAFAGAVPEIYDTLLVPLIFRVYAEDIAHRTASRRPGRVLETAAGTGVVTRALAPRLTPEARYVVTDLNPPMLDRARAQLSDDPRITWQTADATALPFADTSFEAVLCQFGVMFFPDRVRGLAEARRVLAPGGVFLFNTWDRIEENDFPAVVTEGLRDAFGDDAPDFIRRLPHGYHDKDAIAADLRAAGFDGFEIDELSAESEGESAEAVATAFCKGTPLRLLLENTPSLDLDRATDAARDALVRRFGTGRIKGRLRAFVVTAEG
jgi:SAM-dependent methyltransferase